MNMDASNKIWNYVLQQIWNATCHSLFIIRSIYIKRCAPISRILQVKLNKWVRTKAWMTVNVTLSLQNHMTNWISLKRTNYNWNRLAHQNVKFWDTAAEWTIGLKMVSKKVVINYHYLMSNCSSQGQYSRACIHWLRHRFLGPTHHTWYIGVRNVCSVRFQRNCGDRWRFSWPLHRILMHGLYAHAHQNQIHWRLLSVCHSFQDLNIY